VIEKQVVEIADEGNPDGRNVQTGLADQIG
jgi:hypothetical protein